jgi:hypothetical protein
MGREISVIAVFIERVYREHTNIGHEILSEITEKKEFFPLSYKGHFFSFSDFIMEWKIKFTGWHQLRLPLAACRGALVARHLTTLRIENCNANITVARNFREPSGDLVGIISSS